MPDIYVACLASYNAGMLHGEWIDAAQDAEDIEREIIEKVLLTSPENINVKSYQCADCEEYFFVEKGTFFPICKHCGHSITFFVAHHNYTDKTAWSDYVEEWAIHDHQDFDHVRISEYESLEYVSKVAKGIEEHGEPFGAFISHFGYDKDDDWDTLFDDRFCGVYRSEVEYAEQYADDCMEIPQNMQYYFDYERYAKDMFLDGMTAIEVSTGVAVFYDH